MNVLKKIGVGLAGAVAAGMIATSAGASTISEIADATYKLYDGGSPICSAVAISPTQLVTAYHCVDGNNNLNIQVWKLDDKFQPISADLKMLKVIRGFKTKDVALLELREGTFDTYVDIAKPEDVNLKLGDPLITVGYPMVKEITLTHGEFSALAPLDDMGMEGPFYKVTIPVTGGNSGGGLFRPVKVIYNEALANFETEYELIGLTTGGYRNVSFMNYFSNVNSLNEVLKNLINIQNAPVEEKVDPNNPVNPADQK